MADRLQVYMSSTTHDLILYRTAVRDAIFRIGMYPIGLEDFDPSLDNALQVTYNAVNNADVLIGILAYRYGYVPPPSLQYTTPSGRVLAGDGETSIVEWEYRWAIERNIPVLMFVIGDNDKNGEPFAWPFKFVEGEPGQSRLQKFKQRILTNHVVGFFTSPENLAVQVMSALSGLSTSLKSLNVTEINNNVVGKDCIEDFDNRVTKAVLQALEVLKPFQSADETMESADDPRYLRVKPVFSTPPPNIPEYMCDVFIIMPFAPEFQAVYEDVIKPLCKELGLSVKRGDDFFANTYIMEEVWFAIYNCRLVIADCTGRNPNVFYELGIAHTLGKQTIPITQHIKDLPFDVSGRRFVEYQSTFSGPKKLYQELRALLIKVLNRIDTDE